MKWKRVGHIITSWCAHCDHKHTETLSHMTADALLGDKTCVACDKVYLAPTAENRRLGMITAAAVVALACCAFMAQGDRALRESDEYWDAVEAEEHRKERLSNHIEVEKP